MTESVKVRGYMKPISSFKTLDEWEEMAEKMLSYQEVGYDTRGGKINCISKEVCSIPEFQSFVELINQYFNYQLTTEVDRWDLLTRKNILDFIEDFINQDNEGVLNNISLIRESSYQVIWQTGKFYYSGRDASF